MKKEKLKPIEIGSCVIYPLKTGRIGCILSEEELFLTAQNVYEFMNNKLCYCQNTHVEIIFKLGFLKNEKCSGSCDQFIYPTETLYSIMIDPSMNRVDTISCLIHELLHLKQYQTGRLSVGDGVMIFDGVSYSFQELSEYENEDLPWEVEVYKQEKMYLQEYMNML